MLAEPLASTARTPTVWQTRSNRVSWLRPNGRNGCILRSSRACCSARGSTGPPPLALSRQLAAALATRGQTVEDAIRSEGRHQAAEQASMANLIGSLRLISSFDWSEFFESVSLVEQVLQRDPAGVYSRMDFRSRDRYRQAVEELAEPTGEGQLRVALKSVERARQSRTADGRTRATRTSAIT